MWHGGVAMSKEAHTIMLKLTREEGETWRDCAIRYARKEGLEEEVLGLYQHYIEMGYDEGLSAFYACSEWDVLDFVPEQEGK